MTKIISKLNSDWGMNASVKHNISRHRNLEWRLTIKKIKETHKRLGSRIYNGTASLSVVSTRSRSF
jgi:hypothetical protein